MMVFGKTINTTTTAIVATTGIIVIPASFLTLHLLEIENQYDAMCLFWVISSAVAFGKQKN
jgi:hypothetical protein